MLPNTFCIINNSFAKFGFEKSNSRLSIHTEQKETISVKMKLIPSTNFDFIAKCTFHFGLHIEVEAKEKNT